MKIKQIKEGLRGKQIDNAASVNPSDGKRFVAHADEKLTAFVELESAIHEFAVSLVP